MLQRKTPATYRPFRATLFDGRPIVFDVRLQGVVVIYDGAGAAMENVEALSDALNVAWHAHEARMLLRGWEGELATLIDAACEHAETCGELWQFVARGDAMRSTLEAKFGDVDKLIVDGELEKLAETLSS